MKTAMQLHIEDLYKIRQMVLDKRCDSDLENTITETIDGCIENAESFLEKEQQDKVEFAKMHVTEALRQASENANIRMVTLGIEDCASVTKSVYHSESGTDFKVHKQSILNAYPLDQIK